MHIQVCYIYYFILVVEKYELEKKYFTIISSYDSYSVVHTWHSRAQSILNNKKKRQYCLMFLKYAHHIEQCHKLEQLFIY